MSKFFLWSLYWLDGLNSKPPRQKGPPRFYHCVVVYILFDHLLLCIFHLFSFVTELFFPDTCSLQEDNCLWVIPTRVFRFPRRHPITSRSQNTLTCVSPDGLPMKFHDCLPVTGCLTPYLHTRGLDPTNGERPTSGGIPHWPGCLTLSQWGTGAPPELQYGHLLQNYFSILFWVLFMIVRL